MLSLSPCEDPVCFVLRFDLLFLACLSLTRYGHKHISDMQWGRYPYHQNGTRYVLLDCCKFYDPDGDKRHLSHIGAYYEIMLSLLKQEETWILARHI